MRRFIPFLLLTVACSTPAQVRTYNARTDVTAQAYPGSIPCPGSSCAGGGSLTGSNFVITPTDFSLPITRITDVNTGVALGGSRHDVFGVNCGGSAETNFMNTLNNRFYLCDGGTGIHMFTWNNVTATETYIDTLETASYFASFTQSYVFYSMRRCGAGSADDCIESIDFTNASVPVFTQLVDLSTTCGVVTTATSFIDDIIVSKDDQTFGTILSTGGGQGSSQQAVVWNRTNGCRVYDSSLASMSGSWGTNGAATLNDTYTMHNARLSLDGLWLKISLQSCVGGGCTGPIQSYTWQVAGKNVFRSLIDDGTGGCGHNAIGYSNVVNECAFNGAQNFLIRPNNVSDGAGTSLPSAFPPLHTGWDQHMGWNTDNATDTNPFCTSTDYDSSITPVYAWDDEILCGATDGTGKVWRFAHTFNTQQSVFFVVQNAIGAVSQDGRWFAWATDYNGELGNTDLVTTACTVTTNCRGDVFMMALPISTVTGLSVPLGHLP